MPSVRDNFDKIITSYCDAVGEVSRTSGIGWSGLVNHMAGVYLRGYLEYVYTDAVTEERNRIANDISPEP